MTINCKVPKYDKDKLIKNYAKVSHLLIDASNIRPTARLLWIYLSSNDYDFLPDTAEIAKSLGINRKTVLNAKKLLLKHNMIEIEEVKNKQGGDKHNIYLLDPSVWIDIVYENKRSKQVGPKKGLVTGPKKGPTTGPKNGPYKREIENKRKIDTASIYQGDNLDDESNATSNKTLLDNQGQNRPGDNTNRKKEKKIDRPSIYQDDKKTEGEDMKSRLSDHEFRKELKQNAKTKAEKLERIRKEVSILEKKLAAKSECRVTREDFLTSMPRGFAKLEKDEIEGIKRRVSEAKMDGSPDEFKAALAFAFNLYLRVGKKAFVSIMDRLQKASLDNRTNFTCANFTNLYQLGFEETWSVSLFEYLIMDAKPKFVKKNKSVS